MGKEETAQEQGTEQGLVLSIVRNSNMNVPEMLTGICIHKSILAEELCA